MIKYVKLEINLHGLNEPTYQQVINRVQDALNKEFGLQMDSEIEIELIESAGKEEPDDK